MPIVACVVAMDWLHGPHFSRPEICAKELLWVLRAEKARRLLAAMQAGERDETNDD